MTLVVDSGQTGSLKLIPGWGGSGWNPWQVYDLFRSYWIGDCSQLVFKQYIAATYAIELE